MWVLRASEKDGWDIVFRVVMVCAVGGWSGSVHEMLALGGHVIIL